MLLRGLAARRARRRLVGLGLTGVLGLLVAPSSPAFAQGTPVCGDVVADDVLDVQDLLAIRGFLAGDPAAPDLAGDADLRARCDVDVDGQCRIEDWGRIRRYLLAMPGGMDETCTGALPASVVLPAPTVEQASSIATDRASVSLSGTAYFPTAVVRVMGALGRFQAVTDRDGTWRVEVPLALGQFDTLSVRQEFGVGHVSEPTLIAVDQMQTSGGAALEGRVVDAATGSPLQQNATLTISGLAESTDSAGRFLVEGLPYGQLAVRAEAPGYVPEIVVWDASGKVRRYADSVDGQPELEIPLSPRADPVTVDSAGGTITTPGGAELVVPPGSLASPTQISLSDLYPNRRPGYSTRPFVEIHGPIPIVFDPPASLRIPLDDSLPPGTVLELMKLDPATYALTSEPAVHNEDFLSVELLSANAERVEGSWVALTRRFQRFDQTHVTTVRYVTVGNCYQDGQVDFSLEQQIEFFGWADAYSRFPETIEFYLDQPERIRGPLFDPTVSGLADLPAPADRISVYEITISSDIYRSDVYLYEPIDEMQSSRKDLGEAIEYVPRFGVPVLVESYQIPCGCGSNPRYNGFVDELAEEEIQMFSAAPLAAAASAVATQCVASSWGDPHLIRFDHVGEAIPGSSGNGRFDFQASGEFVLFESTRDDMVLQARFEPLPARPSVTITTAAAIDVAGDGVMIDENGGVLEVRVGGLVTPLVQDVPILLPGGGELERIAPNHTQDRVVVRWPDGSALTIALLTFLGSEYLNLYPELVAPRFAEVQGLLGNANGVLGDDLRLRDGTPAEPADLYTTYADSWRISQAESLFVYEPGEDTSTYNGTPPDPDFGLDDLDPADRAAAESTCIAAGLAEDPLLSECALDVALLGGAATGAALDTLEQVPDVGTYVAVSAQANIFQAGQGSPVDFGGGGGPGLLPAEFALPPGTDRVMQVLDSAGAVVFSSSGGSVPPDGIDFGELSWGDWGGVAGPEARRMGATLGVFLDDSLPASVPEAFQCGDNGGLYAVPEMGQVFCLGDGLTSASEPQLIAVPDGATRLFIGFAERLSSQLLEADVHHLGDNYGTAGLFALAPDPEGVSFTTHPFDLPTGFTPSSGRVVLDLVGTDIGGNSIWVNGQRIAYLPVTGADVTFWREDLAFTVDPSMLLPTGNTVEIRSTGGNLDDFLFQDLRFEVAPPLAVLPEPSDPTAYWLGCHCGQFIGDGVGAGDWGLFANSPLYGVSWISPPFDVANPETLGGASVVIDIAQTDGSNNLVTLNGTVCGSLPIRPDGTVWSTEEIACDPAALKKTGNRIGVYSGNLVVGLVEVDDFMMRNARLAVAPEAAVPPGGYSDNSGVHEFIIEVSP